MNKSPGKQWDSHTDVTRPRVMPQRASGTARAEAAAFRLMVARGTESGTVFEIDGSAACPALIGTSSACALRISDTEVSRRHASVDVVGPLLRLRDLGSRNGTFVNGTQVVEALLRGGEQIQIGASIINVEMETTSKPFALSTATSFGPVLGQSLAMQRLYPICERLAQSDVPLVIEGQTGTGKEVFAEAIHGASRRAAGPFVVFDCTAVPGSLIEAALFGHERGAFTGAMTSKEGVFEEANGGTLLIDEIGDLELPLQAKLLRAIQKSEVRRLGGSRWSKVDVRVIAATRRDLDVEVQAGRFRDDLYFRLAVARVALPPLRERREDIGPLARHFWDLYGGDPNGFPEHILNHFLAHAWPGNVRELANTVARLAALGELSDSYQQLRAQGTTPSGAVPIVEMEPEGYIDQVVARSLPLAEARDLVVREFERRFVAHLLEVYGGDVARAAASSGIGARYLRMIRARARRA